MEPRIIPRAQHIISRKNIDPDALKVLYRLHRAGFTAFLVGGGVRDLLLGRRPKDFDVGTSATPSQVRKLFRNCWLIGRRFRLAHIHFRGQKVIEVSTFRGEPERNEEDPDELLVRRDNTFGTPEEDALRRDFTINGLFYDIGTFSLIDYVDGMEDVRNRVVRTIGDPDIRFREDPVRMIRAIKFAARLDFDIEDDTWDALVRHRMEILKSPPSRVLEEIGRLMEGGAARRSFELLAESGFLPILLPTVSAYLHPDRNHWEDALHEVEERVAVRREEKNAAEDAPQDEPPELEPVGLREPEPMHPARHDDLLWDMLGAADDLQARSRPALFATLVYPLLEAARADLGEGREHEVERLSQDLLFSNDFGSLITRRDRERIAQILLGARRLTRRRRKGPAWAIMRKPYFPDALQFLEIHARATGENVDVAERWRERWELQERREQPPGGERFHDEDLEDFEPVDRELQDSREFRWEDHRELVEAAAPSPEPEERVDHRGRRAWVEEPRRNEEWDPRWDEHVKEELPAPPASEEKPVTPSSVPRGRRIRGFRPNPAMRRGRPG
ncbi:MAG: polynucleotide adenylyltransferase PcnB [Candidatus Xenobia bacterium]